MQTYIFELCKCVAIAYKILTLITKCCYAIYTVSHIFVQKKCRTMLRAEHCLGRIGLDLGNCVLLYNTSNVSKNAPTLASCSFDMHGLILIIFGK